MWSLPPCSHSALIQLGSSPNDPGILLSVFFSFLFFWRGASDGCRGVETKLSPHHFGLFISSLHANTLISIRCCSGQPESHDISRAKESTEQLCSGHEKSLSLVVYYPRRWCRTHHRVALRMGTGLRWAWKTTKLKLNYLFFLSEKCKKIPWSFSQETKLSK